MLSTLRKNIPEHFFLRRWYSIAKGYLAALCFGFSKYSFSIIGVTGTDGKTTTVEMITHILQSAGKKVLKISTVETALDGEILPSTKRTTPSPWMLRKLLKKATEAKVDAVVLEVSSHAISQKRIFGIGFDVAAITNITPEHLDYYGTMTAYANAKQELFTKYLKKNGTAVLNADDPTTSTWADTLKAQGKTVKSYSFLATEDAENEPSKHRPKHVTASCKGHSLLETSEGVGCFLQQSPLFERGLGDSSGPQAQNSPSQGGREHKLFLPVMGAFNAYNATAALLAAEAVGISFEKSIEAMQSFHGTPGRMEQIEKGQDFQVFLDFAFTENAFRSLLETAKNITKGKVILVFGSPGSHPDVEVRRQSGVIAARYADIVIVTDDEPYLEYAPNIRKHLLEGAQKELGDEAFAERVREIADRKAAIETALQLAHTGDTVIISGMGHLTSRNIGGTEIPWSDREVIENVLTSFAV